MFLFQFDPLGGLRRIKQAADSAGQWAKHQAAKKDEIIADDGSVIKVKETKEYKAVHDFLSKFDKGKSLHLEYSSELKALVLKDNGFTHPGFAIPVASKSLVEKGDGDLFKAVLGKLNELSDSNKLRVNKDGKLTPKDKEPAGGKPGAATLPNTSVLGVPKDPKGGTRDIELDPKLAPWLDPLVSDLRKAKEEKVGISFTNTTKENDKGEPTEISIKVKRSRGAGPVEIGELKIDFEKMFGDKSTPAEKKLYVGQLGVDLEKILKDVPDVEKEKKK